MNHVRTVAGLALVLALLLGSGALLAAQGQVNINTAGETELSLLPRVGPAIAQRILEHRQENGKFESLEDLMLVRGIGEKTFALLKPYVSLTGETTLKEKVRATRAAAPAPASPAKPEGGEGLR